MDLKLNIFGRTDITFAWVEWHIIWTSTRATSHTRLKAHDHWKSKNSHWSKGRRPSKFNPHTKVKAWRPKEDFMDENYTRSPTRRTMDKVSWSPGISVMPTSWCLNFRETWFKFFFPTRSDVRTYCKANSRIDRQTPPSNSLKLIEFKTHYIKPNPPLFFHQQNIQWSILTSHYA